MVPAIDALVVVVSEQLWPNIQSIWHWRNTLRHVCLAHTDNSKLSLGPAKKLAALVSKLLPEVRVWWPNVPLDGGPTTVRGQVAEWQHEIPAENWAINATGGTKLMFAGAISFISAPRTSVVYRDLAKRQWFELAEIAGSVEEVPIAIDDSETDDIPVADLLEAHWADEEAIIDVPAARFLDDDVVTLTRRGVEHGWVWRKVFEASDGRDGFLFERYVAAVLRALGVTNLVSNVSRRHGSQTQHEVDLVANHRGRLLIVDCKLTSEGDEDGGRVEPITSQIRQASPTRTRLGGRGAGLLLLRVNRELSEAERELCQVHDVHVIDARDARDGVFERIRSFVGVPQLPPPLVEAGKLVDESVATGRTRVFAREAEVLTRHRDAVGRARTILDLDREIDEWMRELGQEWAVYRIGGHYRARMRRAQGVSRAEAEAALSKALERVAEVKDFLPAKTSRTVRFRLVPRGGDHQALEGFLRKRLGRPLVPDHGA
ncbi:hypothetical protein L6R52_13295 [Myxococcota bacterium]|nr:hypothetical protein [Myxococcota bacterium]